MSVLLRHPFALLFLLAFLLRVGYLLDTSNTPIWFWHTWAATDIYTFLKGATEIHNQGLLVPHPHHPYDVVHALTGSLEQWERWLGGEHAFYRVPGYEYFLALILGLSGHSLLAVKLVQALLGAWHATLLGLIGARMVGRPAGIFTGLLAAVYGPFIAVEAMILRDGPGLLLAAAGLYLVLRTLQSAGGTASRVGWLGWLGAGLVLGIGALIKETNLILFGAIWIWSCGMTLRRRDLLCRRVPWLLVCGFLAAFMPLVARNLIVGAPMLAPSALVAWNFAIANAVDHPTGGATLEIPPSVAAVMARAEARLPAVIRLTWRNYEDRRMEFWANWGSRFSVIWRNDENPDNYSYNYLVSHSSLLRALPRFVCIWLPAVAALSLLAWHRLRPTASWSAPCFAPGTDSLFFICLAGTVAALSMNIVVGRYRLLIVPFLLLLAGGLYGQMALWVRNRDAQKLAALSVLLLFLSITWWLWPPLPRVQATVIRPIDFSIAARILFHRDNLGAARHELQTGLRYCSQLPTAMEGIKAGCAQYITKTWKDLFGEEAPP